MKKVAILVFLSAIIFASGEVSLKIAGKALDPFQINFLRFFIGGVVLLPFAFFERRQIERKTGSLERPDRNEKLRLLAFVVLLGVLCVPIDMMLFQMSLSLANAGTVAVIFCANPIATVIFAHFFHRDDKLTAIKFLAIFVCLIGLLFMIAPWKIEEGNTPLGLFFAVASAVLFGLYSALGSMTIERVGAVTQTSISFIAGSLIFLPVLLLLGKPVAANVAANLPLILYTGVIVSSLGYLFYFLAIKLSVPTMGSVTFFIKIVLAPLLALAVLGEKIEISKIIGIIFILAASVIITYGHSKNDRAES
jgi:drug/metabolite transporter (DMT)-like permease